MEEASGCKQVDTNLTRWQVFGRLLHAKQRLWKQAKADWSWPSKGFSRGNAKLVRTYQMRRQQALSLNMLMQGEL